MLNLIVNSISMRFEYHKERRIRNRSIKSNSKRVNEFEKSKIALSSWEANNEIKLGGF